MNNMTAKKIRSKLFLSQFIVIVLCSFQCRLLAQIGFTDITEAAGIDHQFRVYEGMFGGGICVLDLDKDGYEDVFITSGMNDDVLYLNQQDGTFKNIYEGSGLEVTKGFVTQGAAGADVNRDGWVDLVVTTITTKDSTQTIPRAKNLLFLNQGDLTFIEVTEEYGLNDLYSFSTGASFGDFNADGYPDLYIGNYFLEYDGVLTEINDATIVNASKTAQGYLLQNIKGKTFKNVYDDYGLVHRGFGFGGLFTDFDNDQDQDLLINHDFGYKAKPNYLLQNNYPKKSFTYVEKEREMDLRINAMAAAVGDYDNNGFLDYYITNIKFNRFMIHGGKGEVFTDRAKPLGMAYYTISWGANFSDFDHDTDLDLFVANGDLNPHCTPMGNFLFENIGNRFLEKGRASGINDYGVGRGSVIFDIENDGDMDVLFVNQMPIKDYPVPSRTKLFRNDSVQGNWIKVALEGLSAESHGLGSRVEVVIDTLRMIREIDGGGSSHLSQNSTIAHFGVGAAVQVDSINVYWIGGDKQSIGTTEVNQLIKITQEPKDDKNETLKYFVIGLVAFFVLFIVAKLFSKK